MNEKGIEFTKNRPLERIFRNNIARMIDFFIINQQFQFTSREISDLTEMPLRSVQRILPQLIQTKIVKANRRNARILNYELNKNFRLVEILSLYSIETVNIFIDEAIEKNNNEILEVNSKLTS
jgi:hypothetical protein